MRTIPQLFEESAGAFSDNPLIWEKTDGTYKSFSYKETRESVWNFAIGLLELGVGAGDRVAILSEGRREWLIAELGVLYAGAIAVPLSVRINELSELKFRLKHSGCSFIIASKQQVDKIRKIRVSLPELSVIVFESEATKKGELHFQEIIEKGIAVPIKSRDAFEGAFMNIKEDDLANISYTSGTTADPKGIMLTHRNYTANIEQANSLFDVPSWYKTLLILSWDHSFAHTVGLYVLIKNGASLAVVDPGNSPMERLRNIPVNLKEIQPTFQLSVPALARSLKKNIESGIKKKGNRTEKLFEKALLYSARYHGNGFDKPSLKDAALKPLIYFFDKILFSKIRQSFGGKLKFFIGGGALLDIDLQRFFYAIGVPMFQGYGLTEAAPVISSNTPKIHKLGSSGQVVKNLELRIEDTDGNLCPTGEKGEIVVRGENVMKGYWKNEEATAETLIDGWLHTGDMGYLDEDGFLYVLGRFKSLLIGNDGEKYSPEGIEEALIDASKYIDQCMLYNNQNPFTSGLVVPNKHALIEELKSQSIDPKSEEGIMAAIVLIKTDIEQFFKGGQYENTFPQRWLPSSVGIVDEAFTEENGMINSTLKMVRSKVESYFGDTIEYIYTPDGKNIDNPKNRLSLERLFN